MAEANGKRNGVKRDRDPITGRFLPGNGGGPGRPPNPGPTTAELKAEIRKATKASDIIEIWLGAIEDAKNATGSTKTNARKFVFDVLGLIEILIDVKSGGKEFGGPDAETIAEALQVLGIKDACEGCGAP